MNTEKLSWPHFVSQQLKFRKIKIKNPQKQHSYPSVEELFLNKISPTTSFHFFHFPRNSSHKFDLWEIMKFIRGYKICMSLVIKVFFSWHLLRRELFCTLCIRYFNVALIFKTEWIIIMWISADYLRKNLGRSYLFLWLFPLISLSPILNLHPVFAFL